MPEGVVWYDSADSVCANGEAKVRPQWRTSAANLKKPMTHRYGSVRELAAVE